MSTMQWLMNDAFSKLERGFLIERQSRSQLLDYFNAVIEKYKTQDVNSNGKLECEQIVRAILDFHSQTKSKNNGVCLLGTFHNVLYLATKLCFTWNIESAELITELLTNVYKCEGTLEKFFENSIFGTKVTQLISGWRGDHSSQKESEDATLYFMQHANSYSIQFQTPTGIRNFVDVPMISYGHISPLKSAVKLEKWNLAIKLIDMGAITYLPFGHAEFEVYSIFRIFVQTVEKYENFGGVAMFAECFRRYLRTIPSLNLICREDDDLAPYFIRFVYSNGIELREPAKLKHLARCSARCYLASKNMLPLRKFTPESIADYVNLQHD